MLGLAFEDTFEQVLIHKIAFEICVDREHDRGDLAETIKQTSNVTNTLCEWVSTSFLDLYFWGQL